LGGVAAKAAASCGETKAPGEWDFSGVRAAAAEGLTADGCPSIDSTSEMEGEGGSSVMLNKQNNQKQADRLIE
jgi:hypothetical protein